MKNLILIVLGAFVSLTVQAHEISTTLGYLYPVLKVHYNSTARVEAVEKDFIVGAARIRQEIYGILSQERFACQNLQIETPYEKQVRKVRRPDNSSHVIDAERDTVYFLDLSYQIKIQAQCENISELSMSYANGVFSLNYLDSNNVRGQDSFNNYGYAVTLKRWKLLHYLGL